MGKVWAGVSHRYNFSLAVAQAPGDLGTGCLTDRRIADDWLYGEILHHDTDRRARIRHVPRDVRLWAGLLWVKDALLLTHVTRRLVVDLEDAGALPGR